MPIFNIDILEVSDTVDNKCQLCGNGMYNGKSFGFSFTYNLLTQKFIGKTVTTPTKFQPKSVLRARVLSKFNKEFGDLI